MARRVMRAFTLAAETSAALDELMTDQTKSEVLRALLQANETVTLDEHNLSTDDYRHFYTLLPAITPSKFMKDAPRDTTYSSFSDHLSQCSEVDVSLMNRVLRAMNARMRTNKPVPINVSRIVDALLLPAIAKLYEKDRKSEAVTSSRSNAKEGRNKLSISDRRKVTSV